MRFGLDGSRRGAAHDAEAVELLPVAALTAEAAEVGLVAGAAEGEPKARRLIQYAALLRELARRSGRVEVLARAAAAGGRARREAGAAHTLAAEALYEIAETQRLAFVLVSDPDALSDARARLDAAEAARPSAFTSLKIRALRTVIDASAALAAGERIAAARGIEALEASAKALGIAGASPGEVARVLTDRADLLTGLGLQARDRGLLLSAVNDLTGLLSRIDAERLPLSWARVQALRGQALAALGDVAGDAAAIAEGVAALKEAAAAIPTRHAPLDEARIGHALGLALQSLGEACDEDALFDAAVKAFSPALDALEAAPHLPLRSLVAHDSALCLARRAERRGDLRALEQAEAAFRDALKSRRATADPLAWAVTQVALARIYEAQAALRPDRGERADATFALASALEVFSEHGLSSLAAATLQALERVKEKA